MKVAVTGATGVIGRSAVPALVEAGHEVLGLARTPEKAQWLEQAGARAVTGALGDHERLVAMFEGCDAVCNFATHVPVGLAAVLPRAWREHDWLRTEGVRRVVAAAREAGVRRIVQESVSFLYADQGEEWITEHSPLEISPVTEPAAVGESHVQAFTTGPRFGVVLRLGSIVGAEGFIRWNSRSAESGQPVGFGDPEGWAHVVHAADLGPAVVAALTAPSGVYNVGAEPVRRGDLVRGCAEAVGELRAPFVGAVLSRLVRARVEPLTRSLRVSSEHFTALTGWTPRYARFDASWFETTGVRSKALR